MGHIFISYSTKDVEYAEQLVNALLREGFNPWVDKKGLVAGTRWQSRLQKQIKGCNAYILILSQNSRSSVWVEDELITAKNWNKPIFPLLLEDTELFLGIQTVQYEDVRGGKLPSEVFYQRLAKVARRKKPGRRLAWIRLIDAARRKKAEHTAEKFSYYFSKFTSGVKDAVAVTAKVSSNTLKSVANSKALKKVSASLKRKPKKTRSAKTPPLKGKAKTAKKK